MSRVKSHGAPYQYGTNSLRIEIQTSAPPGRRSKDEGAAARSKEEGVSLGAAAQSEPSGKRPPNASAAPEPSASEPFRVATYFGAFDPVHENHIRQAIAACEQFRIDACFLCPNADQGNKTKAIGVPLVDRMEMLQRRCNGHSILRPYNCGGRAYSWEGRCFLFARIEPRKRPCPTPEQECCHPGRRALDAANCSRPPHGAIPNHRPGLVRQDVLTTDGCVRDTLCAGTRTPCNATPGY